ncbi:hypothetical protein, partial [Marimonas lutisalis]|uniref:hypothetical protein n=1 Tax=Marimonas lutisalis TaxID=2545756 RepID=UPI00196159B1
FHLTKPRFAIWVAIISNHVAVGSTTALRTRICHSDDEKGRWVMSEELCLSRAGGLRSFLP